MTYPFEMYGRIVQVYRYKAVYMERGQSGERAETTDFFPTETEAQMTGGTVTALDTTAYEWMDGLEMPDVPNTYAEAVKVYEMGREAYERSLIQATELDIIQAQVTYTAMMTDTLLEEV